MVVAVPLKTHDARTQSQNNNNNNNQRLHSNTGRRQRWRQMQNFDQFTKLINAIDTEKREQSVTEKWTHRECIVKTELKLNKHTARSRQSLIFMCGYRNERKKKKTF